MSGKILITCKEATAFISKKEEGKLSFIERIELFIHFIVCEFCRLFNKQNKFITSSIINYSVDESLTDEELREIARIVEDSSN